jgi:hypothetical protein
MSNKQVIQSLRAAVRKEIAQQLKEGPDGVAPVLTMDKKVTAIAKVAGQGLKAIDLLRSLPDPTQKVKTAVESSVIALEHVFNHMLQAPMDYLDEDPQAVVDAHHAKLDGMEQQLSAGSGQDVPPTF